MQKLDLGVDYNSEADTKTAANEPLTAEPVVDKNTATPSAATVTPATDSPVVTTTPPPAKAKSNMKKTAPISIIIAVIAIAAGSATGVGAFRLQSQSDPLVAGGEIQQIAGDASSISNGDVFGTAEEANFKDSAEGYLQIGGLEGEGSHRLIRPGGEDQTVYLISTVTELDKFDGMNIKVWGETYKGQKVGWLMDVGRVQIVDTEGSAPSEE